MRGGPLYSIRKYCVRCCGDQPREVRLCTAEDCPLYLLRFGKKPKGFEKSTLKAIKERCYDCLGYEASRVKECDSEACFLYPYRLGKNPKKRRQEDVSQYKPLLQESSV